VSAGDPVSGPAAALDGIRILDFSHALAGPYCTLLLSDFGASVFKLESPAGGDMGRGWGPPFAGEQSSFFLGLNRGKQGISIDLKTPEGIDLCLRLIDRMDVLVENFRPAAMDLIVECSSGFMSITGTEQGEQVRSGYAVADINAGLFSAIGILMALRARDLTGRGQYVDISMLDSMISAMSSNYMSYLGSGKVPRPLGAAFPTVVPYSVYNAKDRCFSLAVGSEKLWATFCRTIGREDIMADPRFETNARRVENRHALEEILQAVFGERDMADWIACLRAAGIPCSPVKNFEEVAQDSQTALRNMFPTIDCPAVGPHRVTGPPIKLSETPARIGRPAPALGEHTRGVLGELLGLDADAADDLAARGVIFPLARWRAGERAKTGI